MRAVACLLAAAALIAGDAPRPGVSARDPAPRPHPRMLVAETDPFSGLPALRAKYATGLRPSDDLAGWALSYLLTGEESFARRALEELRRFEAPHAGGSNQYFAYVTCSLLAEETPPAPAAPTASRVRFDTSMGSFTIRLETERAHVEHADLGGRAEAVLRRA